MTAFDLEVRTQGDPRVMEASVTVNGRKMSIAAWVAAVESRLVLLGMTLADLDARTEIHESKQGPA